jgi:iron-sulfur cluster assembly protein
LISQNETFISVARLCRDELAFRLNGLLFCRLKKINKTVMIQVSDKAKERIIELKKEEGHPDSYNIRVSVKGGGCSGLMYDLDFDGEIHETDKVFENKGVKILVDKKSLLYLLGTTLDFSDGLNGKGFQFVNPNASRTCGCGESFAV